MSIDVSKEAVAKMLDEASGILIHYKEHPDVLDQTIRILGSSETMTLHEMLSDMFRFIAYAREAVPALSAERDALAAKLAKAEGALAILSEMHGCEQARAEAAKARNAALTAEVERLRGLIRRYADTVGNAEGTDFIDLMSPDDHDELLAIAPRRPSHEPE